MNGALLLLFHLLTALAKLIRSGGYRELLAENLLLKQQLIIHSRSRQRSPNLSTQERTLLGFLSLFLKPRRIARAAIILQPSTLLRFHTALIKRNYRQLYSPRGGRKPGPAGPSWLTTLGHTKDSLWSIDLFRAESITLRSHWFMVVMDQYTRRIIGFSVHTCAADGPAVCRMFNEATCGQDWPSRVSTDNDPLFQYRQWKANLRVLEIEEIKSVPYTPTSHPFVERLIGSVRRELLDQTLFWTATDLENKLRAYKQYYNKYRCHSSRGGTTPVESADVKAADIAHYHWEKHCRGLFLLPTAA
jgi:transposase InsO family protein